MNITLTPKQAYYLSVLIRGGDTIGGQTPLGNTVEEALNGAFDAMRNQGLTEINITEQPQPLRTAKDTR